jgi:tRNA U34 5-methylaminomethyl-2-thiouridine-forming methyltransferase MnmC
MELVTTEDGSISIKDEATGELHHNRAGAYTEALVNYIQPSGVFSADAPAGELQVLDVCWGMGYNTMVLLEELLKSDSSAYKSISITAIESDSKVLNQCPRIFEYKGFQHLRQIPACLKFLQVLGRAGKAIEESSLADSQPTQVEFHTPNNCQVMVRVILGDLRSWVPRLSLEEEFDLVFHDPFSPKRVPELWTVDLFRCYRRMLASKEGKVLTYSSAAAVRRGMEEATFSVARSTALGGKSGGTVGSVSGSKRTNQFIFALSQEERCKMSGSSGVPYRDPSFSDSREEILARRTAEQAAAK